MCELLLINYCTEELFITVNVECATVSVPQLPASVEERIHVDTISCSAEAGPCRCEWWWIALNSLQSCVISCMYLHLKYCQWRLQRSKGVRSFRVQKILQPGHPDALFSFVSSKKLTFLVVALKTQAANAVSPSK